MRRHQHPLALEWVESDVLILWVTTNQTLSVPVGALSSLLDWLEVVPSDQFSSQCLNTLSFLEFNKRDSPRVSAGSELHVA